MRSHGWYDLPPFSYDRERGILSTVVQANALTPSGRPLRGKRDLRSRPEHAVGVASRDPLAHPRSRREREKNAAADVAFSMHAGKLEAKSADLDTARLCAVARRVFSLDLDFSGAERSFAHEPVLAAALGIRGGRMLRSPTLFEDSVKILFTTNCTWAATRGMVSRLIALAGAEGRAFPDPESVARLSIARIEKGVRCGYRGEALRLFAQRVASGKLDLSAWEDPSRPSEEVRRAIVAERGFGPYAAEGLLRILGRHDFYALDSWTRQQYRRLYPGRAASTDRAIARRYARFGSHRGLALWLDMTRGWHQEDPPDWPQPGPKSAPSIRRKPNATSGGSARR